jgi:hypothetical protein
MPMTNFTYKGGDFIIQNDRQKGLEATYLDLFTQTPEGKKWLNENRITNTISGESPDFILETSTGKNIGLEITKLIIETSKFHATSTLQTIASQVCQYFKKEKGIALSLIIEIYDERKFSPNWKDHLSYHYNPGFNRLDVSKKKIKDTIIATISKEDISTLGLKKEWIDIPPHKFVVTYSRMYEPHISYHVNNEGICKEDPFDELQEAINRKNEKYATYKMKCDKCDLLVVSDGSSLGSFANFSNKVNSHTFLSSFKNVYLLDLDSNDVKSIKLKIFQ